MACHRFNAVILTVLLIIASFPSIQGADTDTDAVPFPPSIMPLPWMKLAEYSGPEFRLECNLAVTAITEPIEFRWYVSLGRNGSAGTKELTKTSDNMYARDDTDKSSDLIIKTAFDDFEEVTGYYWCEAENEHGVGSSSRCVVYKTPEKKQDHKLPTTQVKIGASVRISPGKPYPTEVEPPIDVSYSIKNKGGSEETLRASNSLMGGRAGRFVAGVNFDLYVLEAKNEDSCDFTQTYQQYGSDTLYKYRAGMLEVLPEVYGGTNAGFFTEDMPELFLFVRGRKNSFISCIPKKAVRVNFSKDNAALDVQLHKKDDKKQHLYRVDYALFFREVQDIDEGKYTCTREDEPTGSMDAEVKVVGAPEINCGTAELFVINTPDSKLEIECTLTSRYLKLLRPNVYINNQPFLEGDLRGTLSVSTELLSQEYKIKVTSPSLKITDTSVLRFQVTAEPMTKDEMIKKQGYDPATDGGKVYFNDYMLLPFESRKEISLAVFTMPLKVKPFANVRTDALWGEKGFRLRTIIYGSPPPEVTWTVGGQEVKPDDPKYTAGVKYTILFSLTFAEVGDSTEVVAIGSNSVGEKISAPFKVTSHYPLEWSTDMKSHLHVLNDVPATIQCAAAQMYGSHSAQMQFSWTRVNGELLLNGLGGVVIKDTNETRKNSSKDSTLQVKYGVSTLQYTLGHDALDELTCKAELIASGYTLQTINHEFKVTAGDAVAAPSDFKLLDQSSAMPKFKWVSARTAEDHEMKDVVEWAQLFKGQDPSQAKYEELGSTRGEYMNEAGRHDVEVFLMVLSNGQVTALPAGARLLFRLYTHNMYGNSPYAPTILDIRTKDAVPTEKVQDLSVSPIPGSSKVRVSYKYPRDAYGAYDATKCCVNIEIEKTLKGGGVLKEGPTCHKPEAGHVDLGWDDTPPYTLHTVRASFSNTGGESDTEMAEGYSAMAPPDKPTLTTEQPDGRPRNIVVSFKPLTDDQVRGDFEGYVLTVTDPETGKVVNETILPDQGSSQEAIIIEVGGLTPYTNYSVTLSAKNKEFTTTADPFTKATTAASPDKIDPDSVVVHVYPDGVIIFWDPVEFNGIPKGYKLHFPDLDGDSTETTTDTWFNATDLFFPPGGSGAIDPRDYAFTLAAVNHEFTADPPTEGKVPFQVITDGPGHPLPPSNVTCTADSPARLDVDWGVKQFGQYAETHSVVFRLADSFDTSGVNSGNDSFFVSCEDTPLAGVAQHCEPEAAHGGLFAVHLLAENRYGVSLSDGVLCRSTFVPPGRVEPGGMQKAGVVTAAGAGLLLSLLFLLLLIVLLTAFVVYYCRNRSHAYRVRRAEDKLLPKDVEFHPMKDQTNSFPDYVPEETEMPFLPSTKRTPGPVDMDADSFDLTFGGDDDLDGYNEDGSFIGAYVEDTVYRH